MDYLLDTDFLIGSVLGKPRELLPHPLRGSRIAVSLISLAELYEGAFHHTNPDAVIADLRWQLQDLALLPITDAICLTFGELRAGLRRRGQPRADMDLFIAATAITHDLTLVTRNQADFERIPDLRFANF
jgi:predicted nucleic acid-binding protein